MDYKEAKNQIRNRQSRKIANNTYLKQRDKDAIAVRLHETDIITLYPDGFVTLNSGGWHTKTTLDRLQTYAPFYVYQKNYTWFVVVPSGGEYIFKDGMTYSPKINKFYHAALTEDGKDTKRIKSFKKKLNEYIDGYADLLLSREMPEPSGGDCWYCYMNLPGQSDHLINHVKEKYFVPSLIYRAFEELGASRMDWYMLGYCWRKNNNDSLVNNYFKSDVKRFLKRYMIRHIDLNAV